MDSTTPTQSGSRNEGLKAWLNVMNASLSALEQTLWQGRELAEGRCRPQESELRR